MLFSLGIAALTVVLLALVVLLLAWAMGDRPGRTPQPLQGSGDSSKSRRTGDCLSPYAP